ncbi:crocetin glucosyltransferase 3-like [Syzygium oleosum]|uniref:crocetin glucosyltransferase 3-like n=1 Tax=Syzygium oleosum TaxID=219896 RepID=UPI0024BB1365|nr:crocetin glucosyltransferase 3-like [Syzygium oleosum]
MTTLSYASLSLRAQLESLVADITYQEGGRPPVCIISDLFFGWAVDVAKAFSTRNYGFTTCGAYGTLAHLSLWLHLPHRGTESSKFVVPGFPERCLFDKSRLVVMIREADGEDMWSRFLQSQFELSLSSSGWLCNMSEEFEPLGAAALRNLVKLPVWTIGPLLPDAIVRDDDSSGSLNFISEHRPEKPLGITLERCIEFFDAQPPGFVVYVCFGSQNTITIKTQHL